MGGLRRGPLSYFDSNTFGSTPREFALNAHYGRNVREIVIQIDPQVMTSIRWRFEVHDGKDVEFSVIHVVEDYGMGGTGSTFDSSIVKQTNATYGYSNSYNNSYSYNYNNNPSTPSNNNSNNNSNTNSNNNSNHNSNHNSNVSNNNRSSTGGSPPVGEDEIMLDSNNMKDDRKYGEKQIQAYLSSRENTTQHNSDGTKQQNKTTRNLNNEANEANDQDNDKDIERKTSFTNLHMHEVVVVPSMSLKSNEGSTEWTEPTEGLVILRWSFIPKKTNSSMFGSMCGIKTCCQQKEQCVVRYEVQANQLPSSTSSSTSSHSVMHHSSSGRIQQTKRQRRMQQQESYNTAATTAEEEDRRVVELNKSNFEEINSSSSSDTTVEEDEKGRFFSMIRQIESCKISHDTKTSQSCQSEIQNALRRRKRKQPSPASRPSTPSSSNYHNQTRNVVDPDMVEAAEDAMECEDASDDALFSWRAQAEANAVDAFRDEMEEDNDSR